MAFAIQLVARGFQAARSGLVAIKDGILGVASAERRLAQDIAHAARESDKLASSAKKAQENLKAAAAAFRLASTVRGINPLTGGAMELPGVGAITGIRRAQLLYSIQRSGMQGYADLAANRDGAGGGDPGHLFGRLGGRIGRIFGSNGSKIGEALGGTLGGMAPALGAVTIGAVAAGLALNEFGKSVDRAKESVRKVEGLKNEIRDAIIDSIKSANAAAIGEAKANQGAIASLIGSGKLEEGRQVANGLGADGLRAAGILNQKRLLGNKNVIAAMRLAVGTGQISAEQFASTIGSARGLSGIGSAEGIAKAVLAQNGAIGVDVNQAGARFGASKFGQAFNALDAAEESRSGAALGRFAQGGTEVGIREEAARIASPQTAALQEIQRRMDDEQKTLAAMANSQSALTALFDAIVNRGDSAKATAARNATDARAAGLSASFTPVDRSWIGPYQRALGVPEAP